MLLIWLFRGTIRLHCLLAFFAARARCVCLAVCVSCICAGSVMVWSAKHFFVAVVRCLQWSLIHLSAKLSACNTYHSTSWHTEKTEKKKRKTKLKHNNNSNNKEKA